MKSSLIAIILVDLVTSMFLLYQNHSLIQQRDKLMNLYEQSVEFNTQLIDEKLREDSILLKPSRITPHTPILD